MIKLQEGKTYQLVMPERTPYGIKHTARPMKLLKKYREYALFRDSNGLRICYCYMDIRDMLQRPEGEQNENKKHGV